MDKLIKLFSINTFCLVSFFLLSSLFVAENVFARDHWDRSFTNVTVDPKENSISIKFVVFDYHFAVDKLLRDHAYLSECEFYFTLNGKDYKLLMRAETLDQEAHGFTMLKMRNRCIWADLQFLGCRKPANGSWWTHGQKIVEIEVVNDTKPKNDNAYAQFTVKWVPLYNYRNVKRIRICGVWTVRDLPPDEFNNVDYDIPSRSILKSAVNQTENNLVKVNANADAIDISGAENGEKIKVYNVAGVEVQSTVTKGDVVNIKLPKNKIYFVNIGQAHYKVAM